MEYRIRLFGDHEAYLRAQDKYNSRNNGPFAYQNPDNINYDPWQRPNEPVNLLDLRAGINAAMAWSDGIDIYGTGVNLAARLATLAGPGETIASASAHEQLAADGTRKMRFRTDDGSSRDDVRGRIR